MSRVLVVAADRVGERMAGPGIRALELGLVLAREHEVTLATPDGVAAGQLRTVVARASVVGAETPRQDIALVQGSAFDLLPTPLPETLRVVIDLYDPFPVEGLELRRDLSATLQDAGLRDDLDLLRRQVAAADFILCASERQRRFWLGVLAALGRITPGAYAADRSLRSLLDVVPFGIATEPPPGRPGALRGELGFGPDDIVVIWGGGVWNWLDATTLVRATAAVAADLPHLKVVFLGAGHPNPAVPTSREAAQARAAAKELGVEGRNVFFRGDWVAYRDRGSYLADADIAVTLGRPGIEEDLAFRTRLLDYLWAGLPMLLAGGDELSQLLYAEGCAELVPAGDPRATAAALRALAESQARRAERSKAARRVAARFRWEDVAGPLQDFCREPRHNRTEPARLAGPVPTRRLQKAWGVLRSDGPLALWRRTRGYVRRRT